MCFRNGLGCGIEIVRGSIRIVDGRRQISLHGEWRVEYEEEYQPSQSDSPKLRKKTLRDPNSDFSLVIFAHIV